LPPIVDPNVLVGIATRDDAAIYRLGADMALVATIDVFTPIVDDPYDFGRIAAANSLSDVYAMGGRPLFALSFVGFPAKTLPLSILEAILRGGADKAAEAGIAIVGGHSIDDAEPKYGLSVVGVVHPDRVLRNSTARAGDVLVLTKPLGTGILSQGIKKGTVAPADAAHAIEVMAALNRAAADAVLEVGASACTDVTGFGLLGHLHEVAHGSGVSARVRADAIPILGGARAQAEAGVIPGGSQRNADYFGRWIDWSEAVPPWQRTLLCDAQTSGGLLACLAAPDEAAVLAALARRGVAAVTIGRLESGEPGRIAVEP
jgi:selenium donor protein